MAAGTLMHPGRHPGRFRFPRRPRAYLTAPVPAPTVPGVGPAGAATFALSLQPGTKIIFGWSTAIFTSYSGIEQRESPFGQPRRRVEGNAFLLDAGDRDTKGALMRAAAQGSTFLLALPFEALTIAADSTGVDVAVASTAGCDWAQPGQRVVVAGRDGSRVFAVVQVATGTALNVGVVDANGNLTAGTLGATGRAGGQVMPLVPVLLDPAQGFARYPVRVDLWAIRAQAAAFGWAGVDAMGRGTAIVTFDAGGPVAVASLTELDLMIWDRPNAIDGTAAESMLSLTELVDLGALPFSIGGASAPSWARSLKLRSSSPADWQWLKAFLRRARGRQVAFLLPTNRPDLVAIAPVLGGLLVQSASVAGAGDAVSWFASIGSRRLAVTTTGGIVQYVQILAVHDNGDGTTLLSLDTGVFGPIAKVSLLALVRFDRDEIEVTWDGATFSLDETVRVVIDAEQETTVGSAWCGSGFDGIATADGVNAIPGCTRSGLVYTATRELHFDTLTGLAGVTLNTGSFPLHYKTAVVGPTSGLFVIDRSGADAVANTPGAGLPTSAGSLNGGSGAGAGGGSGAGIAATAVGSWPTTNHPGAGGAGGAGVNAGGAGGGGPTPVADTVGGIDNIVAASRMRLMTSNSTAIGGGAGGSSGGGSGSVAGGAGGGGAGNIFVAAGQWINPGNILVRAKGGAGGNGLTSGGATGGGGGGGGGIIALVAAKGGFPLTDNSGGAGGAGGNGGAAGSAGGAGPAPMLFPG